MAGIDWDFSGLKKGLDKLEGVLKTAGTRGINEVADEVLRLSSQEVPHDKGMLQASSSKEPVDDYDVIIGYDKVYAAHLHEHPEYRFQKGRKGKYLEDPIKNNLNVFEQYIQQAVNKGLNA